MPSPIFLHINPRSRHSHPACATNTTLGFIVCVKLTRKWPLNNFFPLCFVLSTVEINGDLNIVKRSVKIFKKPQWQMRHVWTQVVLPFPALPTKLYCCYWGILHSNFQWSNVSIICINMLWLPLCFFRCISQLSHSKHNTTLYLSLTLTFILPFTKITDSSIRSEHSQSHFSPISNIIIISSYHHHVNLKWSAF